jgi:hypothetical protein
VWHTEEETVVEQNEFKPAQHEPDGRTKRVKLTNRAAFGTSEEVSQSEALSTVGSILYQENCSETSYRGEYWRLPPNVQYTEFDILAPGYDDAHTCQSPVDLSGFGYTRFERNSFTTHAWQAWPVSAGPTHTITGNWITGYARISSTRIWFLFPKMASNSMYSTLIKGQNGGIWLNGRVVYALKPVTSANPPVWLKDGWLCDQPKV